MQRKNYTEFDTEFVILDERGKNCTRFGLGAPLSGGRPCCGGHFGRPLKWGVFGDYGHTLEPTQPLLAVASRAICISNVLYKGEPLWRVF